MKTIQITTILLFLLAGIKSVGAQEAAKKIKDNRRDYTIFLKRTLQLDSAKAEQVTQVQQNYKDAVAKAVADTSLSESGKRSRIQQIIEDKNKKLKLLLNSAQQQRLIPPSESVASPAKQKP